MFLNKEVIRIESEAAELKRREYITSVTNQIMERSTDLGVTLLMPHTLSRDLFKKLSDQGEKFGVTARDKKNIFLKPEDLEILFFEVSNPMPSYVLKHLYGKEAMLICWKLTESEERTVLKALTDFSKMISCKQEILDEHGKPDPEKTIPPMLKSMTVQLTDEEYEEIKEQQDLIEYDENAALEETKQGVDFDPQNEPVKTETKEQITDEGNEECETKPDEVENPDTETANAEETNDSKIDAAKTDENTKENPENEKTSLTNSEKSLKEPLANIICSSVDGRKGIISPIWTPANKRAHAAFIYYYLRHVL